MGFFIFLVIAFTDYLLRDVYSWQRWFCFILVGSFPFIEGGVGEFRPDFATGLLTAIGVVLILRDSLADSTWRRRAFAGVCLSQDQLAAIGVVLALLALPSSAPSRTTASTIPCRTAFRQ